MGLGRGGTASTVLVVEDDPALRLLCTVNLELDGYRVLEAPTVGAARGHLDAEEIDVVFLDVHIAGESGYDLIDPIRSRGATPIVLMSGTAELTPADRARVDAVLSKPFEPEDLAMLVSRLSRPSANG
jgi:two-component system, OmpR family, response regulator